MCGWVREVDIQNEEHEQKKTIVEALQSCFDSLERRRIQAELELKAPQKDGPQLVRVRAALRAAKQVLRGDAITKTLVEEEHKCWAKMFGAALVLAIQGDYSEVDRLAREVRFEFVDGEPVIKSEVLHDSRSQSQGKDTSGACAGGLNIPAVYGL